MNIIEHFTFLTCYTVRLTQIILFTIAIFQFDDVNYIVNTDRKLLPENKNTFFLLYPDRNGEYHFTIKRLQTDLGAIFVISLKCSNLKNSLPTYTLILFSYHNIDHIVTSRLWSNASLDRWKKTPIQVFTTPTPKVPAKVVVK